MKLTNCYPPEWMADGYKVDDLETSQRLRIALCCHFYVAYAIRQGIPRSRVAEEESQIRADIHGHFGILAVFEVKRSFRSRCDVCAVLELVERLAKSQFAQGSCEFILQTRNNEAERAGYDWVAAFQEYEAKAQLGRDSRLGIVAAKAIAVMGVVQDIRALTLCSTPENPKQQKFNVVGIDAMSVSDIMQLVQNQIKMLDGHHLRIVE